MSGKTIVIADDHPLIRQGLIMLLKDRMPHFSIYQASDGIEAIAKCKDLAPTVAVLDISMPKKNGLEVLTELKDLELGTSVIMLTMHHEDSFFEKSLELGAKGYLLKEDANQMIIQCIETVLEGKEFISPKLNDLSKRWRQKLQENSKISQSLASLSNSELNVLKLIALEKPTKEIAEMMFVTPKSVDNYRSRICKKLDLDGKNNSLLIWVLQHKELISQINN